MDTVDKVLHHVLLILFVSINRFKSIRYYEVGYSDERGQNDIYFIEVVIYNIYIYNFLWVIYITLLQQLHYIHFWTAFFFFIIT